MNASVATTSSYGRLSLIASTAYLLLLLLMRKFSACTVVLALSLVPSSKLRELWDLLTFLILVSSAISCGQILIRMSKDGVKMTEVFHSLLAKKSYQLLTRSTILTWSVVLIRSLKTDTSFSQRDNLSLFSQHPTIVVNSTTQAQWWVLTIL